MFLFHRARLVSSIGADEAMPALDTRISTPPNSTAVSAKAAATAASSMTFMLTERTTSLPNRPVSRSEVAARASSSMSASITQAPSRR